jgi:hypothetical protein
MRRGAAGGKDDAVIGRQDEQRGSAGTGRVTRTALRFLPWSAAAVLAIAALTGAALAHEKPATQAAAHATPATAAVKTPAGSPPTDLMLVVRHPMEDGRLVVRVGGRTVLSAPFAAMRVAATGNIERALSVSSGRQTIAVQLIDAAGRIIAERMIEGTLAAAGTATLAVLGSVSPGKALTLEWRTP